MLDFYALIVEEDGSAAVAHSNNGAVTFPVAYKATPAAKQGANVTNTLRVTWKGTSGTAYINGQTFSTFTLPQAFQSSFIGVFADGDASSTAGTPWKYSNLKITNVP